MGNKPISISVIMPAYNEEGNFERVALHNIKTFEFKNLDFEVLIVDDGSTDRTGEIAEDIAKRYASVSCYHHEKNMGAGAAFYTGIKHSSKDYVIFAPFDNPLDPEDLDAYLSRMGICDIVVGVRVERVGYSLFARLASFTYNRILVPLMFNIGISDVNWIQVYRRNLFTSGILKFNLSSRIFFFAEILVRARREQLIIVEVPSKMRRRIHGKPTVIRFSIIFGILRDMLSFFWEIRKNDKTNQRKIKR